jgi:hypothetical protein
MWRKAAFSHGELLSQMSQEEKEMMRLTFQNTVRNSKAEKITDSPRKAEKTKKSVSFALENNAIFNIPYYPKDQLFY